jgi:uncharacterized membrane protein
LASAGYIARGFGGAYNEVVVALVEQRRSSLQLKRFGIVLAFASTSVLLLLLIPPVGRAIFAGLLGLADPLPHMVATGLYLLLPLPALTVAQSYLQGVILHSRRTRAITESVGLFLVLASVLLVIGSIWGTVTGIYFALASFTIGEFLRTSWLWLRSRAARRFLVARDSAGQV